MQTHYISAAEVQTVIQVIVALKDSPDFFQWGRPAALSSTESGRRRGGNWKNKLCRQVEQAMKGCTTPEELLERLKGLSD
ncbi:hypothetical protein [Aromatoleum evansii]|uniref:hypothetical protein n=1 Tax=Aromatoleum evansii TaxID=59406 RepID=UPI00145D0655|nr:hypothetical protein [Aromatoleum evansii]NMG29599.1 hypothetical protein [Aromatoleum evansii]